MLCIRRGHANPTRRFSEVQGLPRAPSQHGQVAHENDLTFGSRSGRVDRRRRHCKSPRDTNTSCG